MCLKHDCTTLVQNDTVIFINIFSCSNISSDDLRVTFSDMSMNTLWNRLVKNRSIEMCHKIVELMVVGLHPKTVRNRLSAPFSSSNSNDTDFAGN